MARKQAISTEAGRPIVLLLSINAPTQRELSKQDYHDEFLSLVQTLGITYDHTMEIKLRSIDKSRFLTKGKLHDLFDFCTQHKIDEVVCSELLSPLQERNLEDFLGCTLFDRERLILEIFQNSAQTAEGKIQVEMAQLQYFKTRLAGKGAQLAQQAGHIGTKGPGETEKEYLKRHLTEKLRQAQKRLIALQKSRAEQRKRRLASKWPLICLVGYTNVGKSSIINLLTSSKILAEDKLFATLDTTTRELFIDHKKVGLLSDTVGFISHLPHHLIEAFKSTLDELCYADLLLHVVDISNHAWEGQIKVVQDTLTELGLEKKPIHYLFNKVDKLSEQELEAIMPKLEQYQPYVLTHATVKSGLADLIAYLSKTSPVKV